MEALAPEYGVSNLTAGSLERLRFGIWLGRETRLPVGFTGGVGWAQTDAKPEAQIASQIAATEFGRPLKWIEENSRDTRENAVRTVALLKPQGIRHIVLVTHGYHMPRALRDFEAAAGPDIRIEPRRWAWRGATCSRRSCGYRPRKASTTCATSRANCSRGSSGSDAQARR